MHSCVDVSEICVYVVGSSGAFGQPVRTADPDLDRGRGAVGGFDFGRDFFLERTNLTFSTVNRFVTSSNAGRTCHNRG